MNLITKIRKSYITKGVAAMLALNMLVEIIAPTAAMALTGGPSQPEVQSFEPVETTDMVNMFTGDFTYNIPLMYLPGPNGGYPINLAYHGGVTMDEEASWVGLGWNINAGALVRNVRGFADDANGDTLITKVDMKPNITVGLGVGTNLEIFGGDPAVAGTTGSSAGSSPTNSELQVAFNLGVRYNNYKGFGVTVGANASPFEGSSNVDWSFGLSLDPEMGMGANVSISHISRKHDLTKHSTGLSYDNEGLGLDFSRSKEVRTNQWTTKGPTSSFDPGAAALVKRTERMTVSGGSGLGFSANTHIPVISYPITTNHVNISLKTGPGGIAGVFPNMNFSGYFNTQHIESSAQGVDVLKNVYGYENLEKYLNPLDNDNPYSPDENGVIDFTRQKDGQVNKQMPNLAVPVLTCDIYNVVGQGMSGNFRPFRTDVGRVHDPVMSSIVFGGSIAFDLGTTHLGFGGTVSGGSSKTMPWDYKNEWSSFIFKERDQETESGYDYYDKERSYYRMHGDKSSFETDEMDFIGGEYALQSDYEYTQLLDIEKLNRLYVPDDVENQRNGEERISRNILIHKYTNADLVAMFEEYEGLLRNQNDLSNLSNVAEMSIFYYNWGAGNNPWSPESGELTPLPTVFLDRETRGTEANENRSIRHHNGGFKVLNDQGQYYVYGLPAYNNLEVESMFSVQGNGSVDPTAEIDSLVDGDVFYKWGGTDKFIDKKTKAPYAHSYMLTSILGADYVDVDGNGPSDNDLGYWVRFDYVKYADDYQWRAPYHGANYDRGSTAHTDDDKSSYIYGQKEQWYLAKAETKTHVMVFTLSERNDMIEANGEFANSGRGTQSGLKIDKISLYLKDDYQTLGANAIALQEVHFQYDYFLCQGVLNNDGGLQTNDSATENQGGKLTLKKVWFTYEGSTRGAMTPYEFVYDSTRNFNYNQYAYDRWGNYKFDSLSTTAENNFQNRYLPYVNQFDQSQTDEEFQDEKDDVAGAWGLSQIKLPSGGNIDVVYEADDYAYVQNETATQMFSITAVNDSTDQDFRLYSAGDDDDLYNTPAARRVYFELENPLPDNWTNSAYASEIYDTYVKDLVVDEAGNRNLYFKNYTNLRDNIWEYVSGYVPLEIDTSDFQDEGQYLFGVTNSSGGYYHEGFVTLKQQLKKITHDEGDGTFSYEYHTKYHPMAMAAWQHMRINDPLLLTAPASIDLESAANGSDQNKADAAASLLGFVPQTIQMFTGVWKYCRNNAFATQIDLDKSVIRLCTPDKKKYGGGHRVKQISISDNWDAFSGESESTYGVSYEYETEDENDQSISSGVAQYEPVHGGDEIALRYPKAYVNNVPFNVDNNAFFEHPVNEAYFPAPVVGYSKVTVKSINTSEQMRQPGESPNTSGIGTTGVTVYEFYTAKEYPVIIEETTIQKAHYNVPIPIPFVGKYERKKITAIQGYKIELNDMHGQVKSIKKYGLTATGFLNPDETSSVEYIYSDDDFVHYRNKNEYKKAKRLVNEVDAISNELGVPSVEKRIVGVEYEFFTDQRHHKTNTTLGGGNTNVDLLPPVFSPLPGFWPAFSSSKTNMKTFVTNKVIFKSGILKETRTFDGKASVTTRNEVFDAQTGRPLIVSVNNEFDDRNDNETEDRIYNYSHPAHWEYDQMGAAYRNIDLVFEGDILAEGNLGNQYTFETGSAVISKLVSGDELLVRAGDNGFMATYLGAANSSTGIIHVDDVASSLVAPYLSANDDLCSFRVVRSGRRNHVYADAGTLVTMQFPVKKAGYIPAVDSATVNISETIGSESFSFSSYKIYNMDNVLNATAVLFRDEWAQMDSVITNPFKTGESGIWRPYRSYVYVGTRTAGTSADNRDIRTVGVMDSVELFNWQTPDFENYAANWEWTTEIARYNSEAYEVENVDRLGIKSAALYCAKGSQVLAVGANGGYHEIGVEDFEDFTPGDSVSTHEKELEGNLNFFNRTSTPLDADPVIRSYRIDKGKSLTGGEFIIEITTSDSVDLDHQAKLDVQTNAFTNSSATAKTYGKSYHIPCTILSKTYAGDKLILELKSDIQFSTNYYTFLDNNQLISGRVSVVLDTDRDPAHEGTINNTKIQFTNVKAHTGKIAMRVANGEYVFPQGKLDLVNGKTYVLSAWVSLQNDKKVDFDDVQILPVEFDGVNWNSSLVIGTYTRGKVVEGWQKVEMEFISTGSQIAGILVNNNTSPNEAMYLDDIRISPKTGGIVTYVYDNHNLRLKAMLDNNNYASMYFYDEQGNLHLVKRETERGIQTISENHGHNRRASN